MQMTPQAQRIAIAAFCGWTIHQIEVTGLADIAILPPGVSIGDEGAVWNYAGIDLPDYLADLNAMHEAEKELIGRPGYYYQYDELLRKITGSDGFAWHATAAQRAEAILRAIGKWDDGK